MSNKLPNNLINHLKDDPQFNNEVFRSFDIDEKISSILFNDQKTIKFDDYEIEKPVPWCENGYYLTKMPKIKHDPSFLAGCYYSLGASSMFLNHAIKELKLDSRAVKALDLCAGVGNKSRLIDASLHRDSMIVVNEATKSSLTTLQENLIKWGSTNTIISSNDPSDFARLPGYFDLLVVDVPSSGLLHKKNNITDDWSNAQIKLSRERQERILTAALPSLKTDGYLCYSTSSYSKEENEDVVDWIIDKFGFESVPIPINEDWEVECTSSIKHHANGYRFNSNKARDDDYFFAVLQKKGQQATFSRRKVKKEKNNIPQELAREWVACDSIFTFSYNDYLHIFPKAYEYDFLALQNVLNIKNVGIQIGKLAGKDLIPSHYLALSTLIRKDIQAIDLNLKDALSFLRKETIKVETNSNRLKGWVLMRYKNNNLGWIKAMANRINNYYPKELKIINL